MTLNEIFDEYAEKKYTTEDKEELKYTAGAGERHKYFRKKLISACNCLGLKNLSFLKNESENTSFKQMFPKKIILCYYLTTNNLLYLKK